MAAEPGGDAPWEWGENGADALAWKQAEVDYNLSKNFTTEQYLGSISGGTWRDGQRSGRR